MIFWTPWRGGLVLLSIRARGKLTIVSPRPKGKCRGRKDKGNRKRRASGGKGCSPLKLRFRLPKRKGKMLKFLGNSRRRMKGCWRKLKNKSKCIGKNNSLKG